MDLLVPITPTQYRGTQPNQQQVQFEYESVNWSAVPAENRVGDEEICAWGGYPGAYQTVKSDEFKACKGWFDSTLSEANVVFVTESNTYVYEFVADQVSKAQLKSEVMTVLAEFSRQGIIDGLQPTIEMIPPDFRDRLDFHDDIDNYNLEEQDGELICQVVVDCDRQELELATELRSVNGIVYPKPDRIDIVSEL